MVPKGRKQGVKFITTFKVMVVKTKFIIAKYVSSSCDRALSVAARGEITSKEGTAATYLLCQKWGKDEKIP